MDKQKLDLRDYVGYFKGLSDEELRGWYEMLNECIDTFLKMKKESTEDKKYMLLTDFGINESPDWIVSISEMRKDTKLSGEFTIISEEVVKTFIELKMYDICSEYIQFMLEYK